jgi:central kinetochore subunit Mis15/CHL4
MPRLTVPTTARLPSSLRVESSHTAVVKLLNRLSRASLLSLVLDWLGDNNQTLCPPLLRRTDEEDGEFEDDFYPPATSLEELRALYTGLQATKGSRRDIVDRIVDGDWRHGLTLYQLAMADLQYLNDHPTSLKWAAYKIEPLKVPRNEEDAEGPARPDKNTLNVPRFHPSTFLQNLQAEVLPDVKAHYNFDRPRDLPLLLLRIFILDSPYNTGLAVSNSSRTPHHHHGGTTAAGAPAASFEASRTIYIAFPDSSPHIYISRSQSTGATTTGDSRSLGRLVLEGIPKALSRPRERYALRATGLASKNLAALLTARGATRTNAAQGGWGLYAEDDRTAGASPLDTVLPTHRARPRPPLGDVSINEDRSAPSAVDGGKKTLKRGFQPEKERKDREAKRRKEVAQARFGNSAEMEDEKGVERLDVMIEDALPGDTPARRVRPPVEAEEDEEESGPRRSKRSRGGRKSDMDLGLDEEEAQEGGEDAQQSTDRHSQHKPRIRLTFSGSHVFAGIRKLVEAGIIDGERMPGWMTGEEGVTSGIVRGGRIRGYKGSGV